ncbi:MAG: tyrosine-type recombinase/integrase [Terriglobales bacterium]
MSEHRRQAKSAQQHRQPHRPSALNRCATCGKAERDHDAKAGHDYERDGRVPEWHAWHAARRGLGSNLYRMGVPEKVIQRVLRHANVSTTATYYIKTAADDVRKAMAKLENHIAEGAQLTADTIDTGIDSASSEPPSIQ